jgi:hypothetical protein
LTELEEFREQLTFDQLIGNVPDLSPAELTERLREKALELSQEYYWEGREPLKNILADSVSLGAFAILIATGKQELGILKSFIDEVAYDLSDSAKAFIIILFTDVFVGFHSPHGWDVIIRKSLEHFGLPDNEDFVNMFIATFPVMLDAVFKYWIFRYLNQISPSGVETPEVGRNEEQARARREPRWRRVYAGLRSIHDRSRSGGAIAIGAGKT